MNEDTRTLNAFLTAVAQLQEPLPSDMLRQLHTIEQELPESIYKLYELAEQFEPLHAAYLSALRSQTKEGERLKSAAIVTTSVTSDELDELLFQLRYQIALLQNASHEDMEISDQELAHWQNSVEAEHMEQQWMETFANSQDILAALADEALEEFRQGRTQPLDF
ncbi:MAG: hypothetical protein HC769_20745 [Cyanobacteria bacterium CRU_2_1]|nr:hypothetical protein [Cyanobacteria bacterium RU_5_0]NJR61038.1 hypothetical protein [Cyanobacteria bacterium CRU_2_1]